MNTAIHSLADASEASGYAFQGTVCHVFVQALHSRERAMVDAADDALLDLVDASGEVRERECGRFAQFVTNYYTHLDNSYKQARR